MGWLCGPGSSSVDLAAPQQASAWMSRDDGFIDGQGQSPVPQGWGEPNKSQPLLARVCLQTVSYQQKKLSKLLVFPAKRPPHFFFSSLAPLTGNWSIPAPPVLIHAPCAQRWAHSFPRLSCVSQPLQPMHLQTKAQGKVCFHVNEMLCLSNDFMLWFGLCFLLVFKTEHRQI